MTQQIERLLKAFDMLAPNEKAEFLSIVNNQHLSENAGIIKKSRDLGPLASGYCPSCGRG